MRQSIFSLLLFLLSFSALSQSFTQGEIERLQTFNKLYGYVKYFHPSDEAAELDWDAFAIYGVKRILESEGGDFNDVLEELFLPVAPALNLIKNSSIKKINYFESIKQSFDQSNYDYVMWSHLGDGAFQKNTTYKSDRIVLSEIPQNINDSYIHLKVDKNNILVLPRVLVRQDSKTLPLSDKNSLSKLQNSLSELNSTYRDLSNEQYFVLGNIINIWNSIKYFYPYFNKKESEDWDDHFIEITQYILLHKDLFMKEEILKLLKPISDSHVLVLKLDDNFFSPNIYLEYVENKIVITDIYGSNPYLRGSIVEELDDINSHLLLAKQLELTSFGVGDYGYHQALEDLLKKRLGQFTKMRITLPNQKDTTISVSNFDANYSFQQEQKNANIKFLDNDICYLNLTKLESAVFETNVSEIKKYNNIIIDLRGYPSYNGDLIENFIGHFANQLDTTNWLFIPKVTDPKTIPKDIEYEASSWIVKPFSNFKNAKIYFLINHKAISYAESIIGYFAPIDNVTFVGSPTAGANGDVNEFILPGGYTYRYTGSKVLKHDGSRLHGIGFLPDVEVRPTIKGIIEGRDEVLEKAIELASEKKDKRAKTKDK